MIFTPYCDPSPPSWGSGGQNYVLLMARFVTVRRDFIIGALCRPMPALTYPRWYTRLPLVLLMQVPRFYLILSPELSYWPSSALRTNNSAALPTLTGVICVGLSIVLFVNNCHYWLEGIKKITYIVKPSFIVQDK